jgi:alkylhydroperoxidase family enzyme
VDAVNNYQESELFDKLEKLVLRYAEDLTKRFETDERVLEDLKRYLSPRELVELNLTVGMSFVTNLFTQSFDIR